MKGISVFYKDQKIRMHPNVYTDNGFGRAIPPFVTLGADMAEETFREAMQNVLAHSESGVPFRMVTPQETKAYLEAFGVRSNRQLGVGVHLTLDSGQFTALPIDKRGLFGTSVAVGADDLVPVVKRLLGWTKEGVGLR